MLDIQKKIVEKYDKLPLGQRKVAEYLTNNQVEFSMSTVAQIAKKVDISETTVIRLSYNLGFEGFTQMQKTMQVQLFDSVNKNAPPTHVVEEITEGNLFEQKITQDIQLLQYQLENLDKENLWKTVDLLMQAKRVKIAGYLASNSAAHWFYLKLSMMRDNVAFLSNQFNSLLESLILEQGKDTVFFLISMPSYVSDTLHIAEVAKEQGATIIALTDRRLSPVGRIADICLTTDVGVQPKSVISITSVMSYLNLVASGIEMKYKDEVSDRVEKITELYSRQHLVIE